jgi:hypothetical protein
VGVTIRQCGVEGKELARVTVSRRPALSGWPPEAEGGRQFLADDGGCLEQAAAAGSRDRQGHTELTQLQQQPVSRRVVRLGTMQVSLQHQPQQQTQQQPQHSTAAAAGAWRSVVWGMLIGCNWNSKTADWKDAEAAHRVRTGG